MYPMYQYLKSAGGALYANLDLPTATRFEGCVTASGMNIHGTPCFASRRF